MTDNRKNPELLYSQSLPGSKLSAFCLALPATRLAGHADPHDPPRCTPLLDILDARLHGLIRDLLGLVAARGRRKPLSYKQPRPVPVSGTERDLNSSADRLLALFPPLEMA